tara:strand:- start:42 stop:212 length:171 start_codon:yes stop_codon:yes gene_type:complete
MTLNNHQEKSLKKALKEQDKKIKEAYVNDYWMFDKSITDEELTEAYKQIDQIEKPS